MQTPPALHFSTESFESFAVMHKACRSVDGGRQRLLDISRKGAEHSFDPHFQSFPSGTLHCLCERCDKCVALKRDLGRKLHEPGRCRLDDLAEGATVAIPINGCRAEELRVIEGIERLQAE